jgi:enoyl-CoA hydratase
MTKKTTVTAVRVEKVDAVTVVTLTRPEVRNALRPVDARELAEAVEQAGSDPACHAVVLTGEGAFCAGGDLPAIVDMVTGATPGQVADKIYADFQRAARALRDCEVPTVAAVNGAAIGLGLDLALWCDARFLGPGARLGQGWAALGLVPGTGGAALIERLAPGRLATMLGARPLHAAPAAAIGLGIVSADPMQDALTLTQSWSGIGREALEGYARLGRRDLPDDAYLQECAARQGKLLTSASFAERAERMLSRP